MWQLVIIFWQLIECLEKEYLCARYSWQRDKNEWDWIFRVYTVNFGEKKKQESNCQITKQLVLS